jgi:hypothetical protein
VGKGYAEGPAAEEAQARMDALELGASETGGRSPARPAVFGSTQVEPERHFLGWADEVDADALFASGEAWGLTVVRVSPDAVAAG